LPNRYITGVTIDPVDAKTVYVTLGSYSIKWVPPGTLQDTNPSVGSGHLFVSHDAGETFTDISGNLPDAPANALVQRGAQLIVATDVGVFATDIKGGTTWAPLTGLPPVPVAMIELKPDNPNLLAAATYGRGIWAYAFAKALPGTSGGTGIVATSPPLPTNVPLAGPYGFELSAEGWTTSSTSSQYPTPIEAWQRAAPGHASTTSFQVVPYVDKSEAILTSPQIDAGTGGWLFIQWWRKQNTEPCCDPVSVEWTADGINWYSAPWIWDATQSKWRDDLSYLGKNPAYPDFNLEKSAFYAPAGKLQIRFRLTSDDLVSAPLYEGAWVDDVSLTR
jgi:hypothetical protein